MNGKLDKAIAEALGKTIYEWQRITNNTVEWGNDLPGYSTGGNAMLELDREMRERGWRLEVRRWSDSHDWVEANYYHEDCLKNYEQAHSEPLARALAAYKVLTGKRWEGEGE